MKTIAVYLNDLCLLPQRPIAGRELLPSVLEVFELLKLAKTIRRDFAVDGAVKLTKAQFGSQGHTLASLLQGDDYREKWQFMRNLDQMSPWGSRLDLLIPLATCEVRHLGQSAVAMSWARQNESAVLSFAVEEIWTTPFVSAQLLEVQEDGDILSTEIQVPNLSQSAHVITHTELIRNYGQDLAQSSVIYEGEGFVVRMYFNDHNPPHFHVMTTGNTAETIARIAIRTCDVLDATQHFNSATRRRVIGWAENQREGLMRCWMDCTSHRYPTRLGDLPTA